MSLPSSDRRLSVSPLAFLEGQRCGSVSRGGLEVGVRDTISVFHLSQDPPLPWIRTLPSLSR